MKKTLYLFLAILIVSAAVFSFGCSSNDGKASVIYDEEQVDEASEDAEPEAETEEPTTEEETEAPKTSEDIIQTGIWVKYSPQASLFDSYEFSDGIIEHKQYNFENGSVEEQDPEYNYTFMTYKIDGNTLTLVDDSNKEWVWSFSEDEDTLERTYEQEVGTDTFTVTEKMYHYDSLPPYETVKQDSQKRG